MISIACERSTETVQTCVQNKCNFKSFDADLSQGYVLAENSSVMDAPCAKCCLIYNNIVVFLKTKHAKDKLHYIVNHNREAICVGKLHPSGFKNYGMFSLRHNLRCSDPEVTIYSCSVDADETYLLISCELFKIHGYTKMSQCYIMQFCLITGNEIGHHKTSDMVNPAVICHTLKSSLFYTLTYNPSVDKLQLSEIVAKDTHVSNRATLQLDSEFELSVTLDMSTDGEFLIIQALTPDMDEHLYVNDVLVYDSHSLRCLKRYTPITVEPCHDECIFNFHPVFLPQNQFQSSFPYEYMDTMGLFKQSSDVYMQNNNAIFKLPVILSLKIQVRSVIRSNVCCKECLQKLPLPALLCNYLKYP